MSHYIRHGLTCLIMICVVCGCEPSEQKEPQHAQNEVQIEQKEAPHENNETQHEQQEVQHEQAEVQLPRPTQLTISFETSTTSGKYSPKNVHAVWVETAAGDFVRTLDLWGNKHAKQLTEFKAAVGDLTAAVAARTGATQKAYGAYSSRWDLKDAAGNIVPDGDYVIRLELTSDNADKNKYHRTSIPFTKSEAAEKTEPVNQDGYLKIVLDYASSDN